MSLFERERTSAEMVLYALYLYFLGLSFRKFETMLQVGSDQAWLRIAVEPIHRQILGVDISRHKNMLVAESFLRSLIKIYGKHTVYSDGGSRYPEECSYLGLEHILHSPYEKSIVGRTIQYLKDRTEAFGEEEVSLS